MMVIAMFVWGLNKGPIYLFGKKLHSVPVTVLGNGDKVVNETSCPPGVF